MELIVGLIVATCAVFTVWMVLYMTATGVRGLFRFVFGWENDSQRLERARRKHEAWLARFSGPVGSEEQKRDSLWREYRRPGLR